MRDSVVILEIKVRKAFYVSFELRIFYISKERVRDKHKDTSITWGPTFNKTLIILHVSNSLLLK